MSMNFSAGSGPPKDLLSETEELYRGIAEDLFAAMTKVKRGEWAEAKGAAQAVKDLRTAFVMVMEERTRVEKLRKQHAGEVGGGALDLELARDEIGRRLACLRDAGGGG
ncbi:hypothetical protein [Phaeovulum sp. W22_SRMD_FR3]|jgi:hypothetical protein|uniref:hypothetical protein n=1 Tax=Phaeovulum sp. W22_SRMD_FR3 TaxID=3240274 RepID=UPI003F94B86C